MKISIGRSRKDMNWRVVEMTREELRQRLSQTYRTRETMNEYKAMKKSEKDKIKDIGGFVGGDIEGGRRKRDAVKSRSLITLDADYAQPGLWDVVTLIFDYEIYCYSTHSHTPNAPRLRFVIPLDREVSPEEYEPLARLVAQDLGINQFDVTTYEACRLMYWPSTSSDGEFFYREQLGDLLPVDETLARYKDWRNTLEWPLADQEQSVQLKSAKAQGEPTEKPGVVGLFCRAYDIPEAIEKFLPDVYEPCDVPNRYTYTGGSTAAGVVLYQDGKFSYSHHATDPAGGKLCNAFDLVRLHKYADLDYKSLPKTPVNKLPSFVAMQKLVNEDEQVRRLQFEEMLGDDGKELLEDSENGDWMLALEPNSNGKGYVSTIENLLVILNNDPRVKDRIRMNTFENRIVIEGRLPWTIDSPDRCQYWDDYDTASLLRYLERYKFYNISKQVEYAITITANEHSFHPVREYLTSLTWDGVPRVDTMLVDYLNAEDSEYTRTVTRKWVVAGVRRIMEPGCKFDNMLVLVGAQGLGKSYLARKLSKGWFTDTEIKPTGGKEPLEALRGKWIVEWAELTGMKKAEIESIKSYISSQVDSYRPAYGRHVQDFKRQAIFLGSTNDTEFLRDTTGNRRFWPVKVKRQEEDPMKLFRDLTDEVVDQIWAEAMELNKAGETLYLTPEMSAKAEEIQVGHMEDNPWLGMVEGYLDRPLPEGWEDMDLSERRGFAQGHIYPIADPPVYRQEFSLPEIDWELSGVMPGVRKNYEIKEMHNQFSRLKGWERGTRVRTKFFGRQTIYRRKESPNGV